MSQILAFVMIICAMYTKDPTYLVAAGLFAIAAEIDDHIHVKESKQKDGDES